MCWRSAGMMLIELPLIGNPIRSAALFEGSGRLERHRIDAHSIRTGPFGDHFGRRLVGLAAVCTDTHWSVMHADDRHVVHVVVIMCGYSVTGGRQGHECIVAPVLGFVMYRSPFDEQSGDKHGSPLAMASVKSEWTDFTISSQDSQKVVCGVVLCLRAALPFCSTLRHSIKLLRDCQEYLR